MHVTFHKLWKKKHERWGERGKDFAHLSVVRSLLPIFQPGNNTSMTCYDAYGRTEIFVCNGEGVFWESAVFVPLPPSRLTFKALNSTNRENRSSRSNLPPANTQLSER